MLPPAVAGIGLLAAFGRFGLLGERSQRSGSSIAFTQVGGRARGHVRRGPVLPPGCDRGVRGGRSGAARRRAHARAAPGAHLLPGRAAARGGGLGAGWALAFARGIGEFGATIMFAGSLQGVTQTLSLAIYEQFDVDFDVALAIGAELVVVSAALLLAVKLVPAMDALHLALDHPLRSFALAVELEVGRETVALVGPVRSGEDERAARDRRPAPARPRADRARRRDLARHRARGRRPPERRSVGLVFQEYALFPHLSVAANVGFGGRGASTSCSSASASRTSRARGRPSSPAASASASRSPVRSRATPRPAPRRAALGARRAHARRVRAELAELLAELRLPTLLVTHDFEDAAALADRVGVIVDGRISSSARRRAGRGAGGRVRRRLHRREPAAAARPGRAGRAHRDRARRRSPSFSTDPRTGPVGVVVYPWDVALAREEPDDSALNHVRGP